MEYPGHVENGVIVLDDGPNNLPEGQRVVVEFVPPVTTATNLADALLSWAGKGIDLPPDLARNHDHYLVGIPKSDD